MKKTDLVDRQMKGRNNKIDLHTMKAHQTIINDGTFDKKIKIEERREKIGNIEEIFDKKKSTKKN